MTERCIDILEEVIGQACLDEDGNLDSWSLSAYARGLRYLARRGRIRVISEYGRTVIGEFIKRGD